MSDELATAANRVIEQGPGPWPNEDYTVLLALTREAAARFGWAAMTYECAKCGFSWEIWCALGVEGPPDLKERGLSIASPFGIGRCPSWPQMEPCDGEMSHVRFSEDRHFAPRMIPDDAPRFVLPDTAAGGAMSARLEIPLPALVRARRAGTDPDNAE